MFQDNFTVCKRNILVFKTVTGLIRTYMMDIFEEIIVIPVHAIHKSWAFGLCACLSVWLQSRNVFWNGMRIPLSTTGPRGSPLVWRHERCPILPTDTCLEVRGCPVRGNPHRNPTRLRVSGNQTCNGGPSCPTNTSTNQILIEFQRTCKNVVQFCYAVLPTDVPVIPVKWSAVVTSSVWKHIHELVNLNRRK